MCCNKTKHYVVVTSQFIMSASSKMTTTKSSYSSCPNVITPSSDEWTLINESIDLLPIPPRKDAYLNDPQNWQILEDQLSVAVELDDRIGTPFYHLEENKGSLQCPLSKNIFHLQSGLLFVLQPGLTFDEATNKVLRKEPGPPDPKKKPVEVVIGDNKVFDASTFQVYERTLALICSSSNSGNWKLPRYPVASAPFPPIRRAQPQELPKVYRQQYANLLIALNSPAAIIKVVAKSDAAKSETTFSAAKNNKEDSEKSTFSM